MKPFASVETITRKAMESWRPPPKLTLSEWADEHYYLSAESSAAPGRWKTIPYQKGFMDAITDARVEQVSMIKSARVGYTKMVNAAVGYFIAHDPSNIMIVQPIVDAAKTYSKEEIAPMLRDCPSIQAIIEDDNNAEPNSTLHKRFPGGVLSIGGANSGAGFRAISRRIVVFDEVDAYPLSAGNDGDPIKLGIKRSEFYWNRKILAGSTPMLAGSSRIEQLFNEGDQRRYYVPCPQCGHMDYFVFSRKESGGHWMSWIDDKPESAHFVCSANGCVIEHKDKRQMVERGEWRAANAFRGHASFHIWTAYSYSPNATWAHLVKEFLEVKGKPEQLKTFVNTALGETWKERGDRPDWERLYNRREHYPTGTIPEGVRFLTAGVDVQKDRVVFEVVGWGANKQSWSIDAGVIPMNTARLEDWATVDAEIMVAVYTTATGAALPIARVAVDSGHNTQVIYNWSRRHPDTRLMLIKGHAGARDMVSTPKPQDIQSNGIRIARGVKVWTLGVDVLKSELYGWLKLDRPDEGSPYPAGYCHFPEHGEEFFKQLTSEQFVSSTHKRTGQTTYEWQIMPGRENHWLDCRVYARAAANVFGLDRMHLTQPTSPKPPITPTTGNRESGRGRKNWFKK